MDPVFFFIKSAKIGVFYQYGYTDIRKNRDSWMLIHHFEAETQGFQRLVDQNDEESLNPPKITFSERNLFSGGSGFLNAG